MHAQQHRRGSRQGGIKSAQGQASAPDMERRRLRAAGMSDPMARVGESAAGAAHREAVSKALSSTGDPEAVVSAGLAAKKAGNGAEAQRLFDRAAAAFERVSGATREVDSPTDLREPVRTVAWNAK